MAKETKSTKREQPPLDYNVRHYSRAESASGASYGEARTRATSAGKFPSEPRRRSFRVKPARRAPIGGSPGELMVLFDDEGETTIDVVAWNGEDVVEWRANHPQEAFEALKTWKYVWVNVKGNSDRGVFTALRDTFELHPLAVEDVWNSPQHPKFEVYPQHLFMILDWLSLRPLPDKLASVTLFEEDDHPLDVEQIGLFLGERFVVTVQEKDSPLFDPIRRRFLSPEGRMKKRTADYVAYALVDTLVDSWFPTVDFFADKVDRMEDEILLRRRRGMVERLLILRQRLHEVQRMVQPMYEAVRGFYQVESPLVTKSMAVYLRDCLDHAARLREVIDNSREQAAGLLDVHIALSSHQMNEVMKVLTLISTIFIPLSFIAGVYGMNFDPEVSPLNMPELAWFYGYPFALLLMGSVALGFAVYFHRRRWL